MSAASTKLIALGTGAFVLAGLAVLWSVKRHDRKFVVAAALAEAALREQAAAAGLGTARGIRIPLYEGDSRQATSVMFGRTAEPLDDGKYIVTDLRVENYTHGMGASVTNYIIEAPKCLIDSARKTASSDGRIVVSRPDGSFMTTGIGFYFRQLESELSISNNVITHLSRDSLTTAPPQRP
ncbi:MAG: hypothetical protein ACKODH_12735 [Limisphaerales bacterium]